MKTQKSIFIAILALGIITASCTQGEKKQKAKAEDKNTSSMSISNVTLDPEKSRVMWAGTMLGIYTHEGTLNMTEASLDISNGKITGGSFTVDMNTMVATDENYNPEEGSTPEKLIGHLKSPDFFDVENYPTASFTITGSEGNTVTGLLTLRGETNEEKVENVMMTKEGDMVKITGDMTVDRKKYGVSWDSPVQDRVLSDDMELKIQLIGK
ncbi:MAG: YceI family protein [Bacteroidales bacterium]|jgi:polyisoprenoid-binding protein YceI|nr:YceI family protein [Bacteroidales bacterium]